MKMEKHDIEWFIDRVGKRVFRTKTQCDCNICTDVFRNGLIVDDEFHAQYLYDCQNELGLYYFDKINNNDQMRLYK